MTKTKNLYGTADAVPFQSFSNGSFSAAREGVPYQARTAKSFFRELSGDPQRSTDEATLVGADSNGRI